MGPVPAAINPATTSRLLRLGRLLGLGILLAALSGCAPRPEPGHQNRLIGTVRREPRTLNRFMSGNPAENVISLLTQATLVRVDRATGALAPRLAERWTAEADGLTYTLQLRKNVLFSDGEPFTAADVVFTFQVLNDPRVGSPMTSSFLIDGRPIRVVATDDHTIRLTFPAPFGPGLAILDSLPILPRHTLEAAYAGGTFAEAWGLSARPSDVVGLGPFVLAEYVSGQRLRFTRNTRFFLRPLPRVDEIDVEIVPEQNAELLRLTSGQSDLTYDFVRAEDVGLLRQAEAQGRVRLIDAGVDIAPEALWFALAPGAPHAKDRPWLQREELRQAISYAVDRQTIVDSVYLGAAVPIAGPITPGHGEWYAEDAAPPAHDVVKARALLSAIGLIDRDGDGMLEDAQGHPARFSILTTKGTTVRERVASVIQDQLRRIGLIVDVVPVETGQLISQWGRGDYDAIYYGIHFDAFDPARNQEFWMSSGSFHLWNPEQRSPATPWEARIDELMRKQATTLDPAARHKIFRDVQVIFHEHLPCVYFAAAKATVAMSARLRGATPSVLQPPLLWNAEALSLDASARQ
jgi:peptide/nickel transport system substrate-binding protein